MVFKETVWFLNKQYKFQLKLAQIRTIVRNIGTVSNEKQQICRGLEPAISRLWGNGISARLVRSTIWRSLVVILYSYTISDHFHFTSLSQKMYRYCTCLVEPGMKIPVFRRFCLLEAKKDSFRRKHTFFCLFFLLGTFYNQMFILFYSAVRFHIQFNRKSIFYFFDCLIFISLF